MSPVTHNSGCCGTTCTAAITVMVCLEQDSPTELLPLQAGF